MPIIRWRPLEEVDEMMEAASLPLFNGGNFPVDVYQDDSHIYIEMHLAGIDPDDIDVEVGESHVHIVATRELDELKEAKNFYHREIRTGCFERVVPLPCAVLAETAIAAVDDGVLHIKIDKERTKETKKVKVSKK